GAVPQSEWTHLASTWDGGTVRHYINGEALPQTTPFSGPINFSDAFLAIGVNSLYNFAPNHQAFEGAVDGVSLYNYALTANEIRALYLAVEFRITSITREDSGLRLAWECAAGHTYVVQTNVPSQGGTLNGDFGDLTGPIVVPLGFVGTTTNYLHNSGLNG